ncbi:MAG: HIT domain-containing protein [Acidobacteria bacterium]|jgi:ATP adenylyltransferase|nr:MAG: HIT domain-containing protein [Acidobacteriota bacterium]GIU81466.1 MAG: HIT family hydrolase [Pyrinomonadaceae bacterium]
MDILWSPWRYDYISASTKKEDKVTVECVFCEILRNQADDEKNFILLRADHNFVILNIYPYTSGHLMIVPYDHIADLDKAEKKVTDEMMDLAKRCTSAIRRIYRPDGINLGMNFGKAAGAGVEGHFHMHILPRWVGDVNFMTAIGQTRTIPESLATTYQKLKGQI